MHLSHRIATEHPVFGWGPLTQYLPYFLTSQASGHSEISGCPNYSFSSLAYATDASPVPNVSPDLLTKMLSFDGHEDEVSPVGFDCSHSTALWLGPRLVSPDHGFGMAPVC